MYMSLAIVLSLGFLGAVGTAFRQIFHTFISHALGSNFCLLFSAELDSSLKIKRIIDFRGRSAGG